MDFIRKYDIELEKEHYYAGETLRGRVVIENVENLRVTGVQLFLRGKAHVEWRITRGGERRTVKEDQYFIDEKLVVWGSDNGEEGLISILPRGDHRFPFEFQLPASCLPCSFESRIGTVRYYLRVIIDIPYASPPQGLKYFTVIGPHIDCIDDRYTTPLSVLKQTTNQCLCCVSGPVSLEVWLEQSAYCCSEHIKIKCEVQNGSDQDVSLFCRLVQMVEFRINKGAFGLSKDVTHQVLEYRSQPVSAHSTKSFHDLYGDLQVPVMPPTMVDVCKVIEINYVLRIGVHMEKSGDDLQIEFPFFITTGSQHLTAGHSLELSYEPADEHVEGGIYISPEFQLGQVYDGASDHVEEVILYRPVYVCVVRHSTEVISNGHSPSSQLAAERLENLDSSEDAGSGSGVERHLRPHSSADAAPTPSQPSASSSSSSSAAARETQRLIDTAVTTSGRGDSPKTEVRRGGALPSQKTDRKQFQPEVDSSRRQSEVTTAPDDGQRGKTTSSSVESTTKSATTTTTMITQRQNTETTESSSSQPPRSLTTTTTSAHAEHHRLIQSHHHHHATTTSATTNTIILSGGGDGAQQSIEHRFRDKGREGEPLEVTSPSAIDPASALKHKVMSANVSRGGQVEKSVIANGHRQNVHVGGSSAHPGDRTATTATTAIPEGKWTQELLPSGSEDDTPPGQQSSALVKTSVAMTTTGFSGFVKPLENVKDQRRVSIGDTTTSVPTGGKKTDQASQLREDIAAKDRSWSEAETETSMQKSRMAKVTDSRKPMERSKTESGNEAVVTHAQAARGNTTEGKKLEKSRTETMHEDKGMLMTETVSQDNMTLITSTTESSTEVVNKTRTETRAGGRMTQEISTSKSVTEVRKSPGSAKTEERTRKDVSRDRTTELVREIDEYKLATTKSSPRDGEKRDVRIEPCVQGTEGQKTTSGGKDTEHVSMSQAFPPPADSRPGGEVTKTRYAPDDNHPTHQSSDTGASSMLSQGHDSQKPEIQKTRDTKSSQSSAKQTTTK